MPKKKEKRRVLVLFFLTTGSNSSVFFFFKCDMVKTSIRKAKRHISLHPFPSHSNWQSHFCSPAHIDFLAKILVPHVKNYDSKTEVLEKT